MRDRAIEIPIVTVGVDKRDALNGVNGWSWDKMNKQWRGQKTVISNDLPLKDATDETLRESLNAALKFIDGWDK